MAVVLSVEAMLANGCAKQEEAQSPKPEAAPAAAPPQQSYASQDFDALKEGWPGASGAGAPEDKGEAEEKAATPRKVPADAVAPPTAQRDRRSDLEAPEAAPPAPAKPKETAGVGRSKKADADELAEWGRSVALLEQSFDQFEAAIALSTPDCPAAEKFRQTVCTLAEHICSLEEQVPTTTKRRCDDGRQRCEQAGQKYRARCDKE